MELVSEARLSGGTMMLLMLFLNALRALIRRRVAMEIDKNYRQSFLRARRRENVDLFVYYRDRFFD